MSRCSKISNNCKEQNCQKLICLKGDRIVSVLGDSDNLDEKINSMLDATENFSREKMGKDLRRSFVKFVERKQNKQI